MNRMMIFPVTVATVAAVCVAALGATITDLGPWYQALEKPGWNPPDLVFPMGWTLIYALITISGITAWRAAPTAAKSEWVIMLFALNGFLNITWSLIFFRMQRPDWAFIELIGLWLSILVLIIYCGRFSRTAAALLVPYLGWVSFAGALNWAVVQLNAPFG
ncbi:TspO/MBR family protein [Erythrobacter sanguineus]|jgi:tryptophan-rich sensory protein|uniref:TspO and MBR related proteins n=1 Tax=Erythrobacter sanguineus TaxID=198312 RepID=A0A1M7RZF4_9SPHN|nr:TspO/MBR family protein [Erythrobacter sanguineus]SHN51615.1 TspO and MBR related proteins [Erythrobacter sanguineus]